MPFFAALVSAGTWHVLSYGTLLGSQVYQSFVNGIVSFRALPRPQFSQLQQRIFPIYFGMSTVLPLIVLLSHPTAAYADLLATETATPMAVAFLTSVVNLAIIGPATTKIMAERKRQETKEGKKYYDEGEKSAEMKALNKRFGTVHGTSALLNLVGLAGTVAYGATLGAKLVM